MRFLFTLLVIMPLVLFGCSTSTSLIREETLIEDAVESIVDNEDHTSDEKTIAIESEYVSDRIEEPNDELISSGATNPIIHQDAFFSSATETNTDNIPEIITSIKEETNQAIAEHKTINAIEETNNTTTKEETIKSVNENQQQTEPKADERRDAKALGIILVLVFLTTILSCFEYRKYMRNKKD